MNVWLSLTCLIDSTSSNLIEEQESFVLCANCISSLFQAQLFPCERPRRWAREVIRCLYLSVSPPIGKCFFFLMNILMKNRNLCDKHWDWLSCDMSGLHSSNFPPSLSVDGARIASSTGIDILLMDSFKLVINDTTYLVQPPSRGECALLHCGSLCARLCRGPAEFLIFCWHPLQICYRTRNRSDWTMSSTWCSSSTLPCT